MALRGNVDQIPLSHILQGLLLNGQEGVLRIEGGSLKRRVRVLTIGLRPLNYSREIPDLLKEVVLKQKVLSEAQFQNILSTWVPGELTPGDFLVRRGILSRELVENELCRQLENVLFGLFATPGLRYEFLDGDDPRPYEIFAPDDLGQQLIYGVNSLLMEALRQADEWGRFRTEIPSGSEVFSLANRTFSLPKDLQVPREQLKELRPLLNGENTVDQIIGQTTLSGFEAYSALYQLKQLELITPLSLESKKMLAEKLRRALRHEEANAILRGILDADPKDDASRLKLISILEKTRGNTQEIVTHYTKLAESRRRDNPEQCRLFLQKVLTIDSRDIDALTVLFELNEEQGKHRDALAVARSVAQAGKSPGRREQAVNFLYRVVNYYPEETFLYHELSDLHIEQDEVDTAIECLRTAAEIHAKKGDVTRLKKTNERLSKLQPEGSPHVKRLAVLERKLTRSTGSLLKFTTSCAALATLFTLLSVLAGTEYFSREVYAQVESDVTAHRKWERWGRARTTLLDFRDLYPHSLSSQAADQLLIEINAEERRVTEERRTSMEKRRRESEREFAEAGIAYQRKEYRRARSALARIERVCLEERPAKDFDELRNSVEAYFREADAITKAAAKAEEGRDFAQAHGLLVKLLTEYPEASSTDATRLPVEIRSTPPGATVRVDDVVLGTTPLLVRVPPRATPRIRVERKGFEPVTIETGQAPGVDFDPLRSQSTEVSLRKLADWKVEAKGSLECRPVLLAGRLFVGTRNGEVRCLDPKSGSPHWTYTVPGNMDVAGSIEGRGDRIYFGSFDGRVYVLNVATGRPDLPPIQATEQLWPIKEAPSSPGISGAFAVNVDSRVLVGISLDTGQVLWSLPTSPDLLLGAPELVDSSVFAVTTGGKLLEIDLETGAPRRSLEVAESLSVAGRLWGGRYVQATPGGRVLAIELKTGEPAWTFDLGDPAVSLPIVGESEVVFPLVSGELLCLSGDGAPRWRSPAVGTIHRSAQGTIDGDSLFVGTIRGEIVCLDARSGRVLWSYATVGAQEREPRGILSGVLVEDGQLFVGSEDHFLYCLPVD